MSAASFNTDRVPTCDDVVSALLSGHPLGQPVSTRSVLMDFRAAAPTSLDADDEIVASIVRIATGRTMAVVFDHRAAPEQPVKSWWRSDAAI
jgi:hypothetical protein